MPRRLTVLCLLVAFGFAWVVPLLAAPVAATPPAPTDHSPAGAIATSVATLTGIAISPLLGTGAYGAYQWLRATTPAQKAALPWYAKVGFWLPAILIVSACAAKDALGATLPPGLKKPLDVLETIENKFSGLVAAGAVVPFTMDAISKVILPQTSASLAFPASGLAMIHLGAIDGATLLNLLTVPLGVAIFAVVWMASHAINVLILLSPWGAVDAALKAARTALLGLITLTATFNPTVSAVLSVIVILVSWMISGWAFRLTVFGTLFCWDFLTFRSRRFKPVDRQNRVFTGNLLSVQKVPLRTYGRWVHEPENGAWRFVYRPWLFLPARSIPVQPSAPSVGKGLFISTIQDGDGTLFILPPRYRGHEEAIVNLYQIEGAIKDAGLLKAWRVLHELFGGGSARAQVV